MFPPGGTVVAFQGVEGIEPKRRQTNVETQGVRFIHATWLWRWVGKVFVWDGGASNMLQYPLIKGKCLFVCIWYRYTSTIYVLIIVIFEYPHIINVYCLVCQICMWSRFLAGFSYVFFILWISGDPNFRKRSSDNRSYWFLFDMKSCWPVHFAWWNFIWIDCWPEATDSSRSSSMVWLLELRTCWMIEFWTFWGLQSQTSIQLCKMYGLPIDMVGLKKGCSRKTW